MNDHTYTLVRPGATMPLTGKIERFDEALTLAWAMSGMNEPIHVINNFSGGVIATVVSGASLGDEA